MHACWLIKSKFIIMPAMLAHQVHYHNANEDDKYSLSSSLFSKDKVCVPAGLIIKDRVVCLLIKSNSAARIKGRRSLD